MFLEDDTKLKIVFFTIVILFIMTVIGLWEEFIKPVFHLFYYHLLPPLIQIVQTYFIRK